MEIVVKGKATVNDSPRMRLTTVRELFDHLPPWQCQSYNVDGTLRHLFYICGKCFGTRGSGPATSLSEIWVPGTDKKGNLLYDVIPKGAHCEQCGGKAWPKD